VITGYAAAVDLEALGLPLADEERVDVVVEAVGHGWRLTRNTAGISRTAMGRLAG